ncbi:hypothetical protein [Pontimicrobium aquaticum]|uniref:Lipoprotein n=1 Tax=Pontimicrobium aquaticum TaxID=2565367 RepID=A0A4U0F337_9FLAO|nr:hypothetical protein [Pontimicrobium aquaticum]TJY38204.1 hypothetical protein E5167_02820 [Pontimicrobium aquaticum]
MIFNRFILAILIILIYSCGDNRNNNSYKQQGKEKFDSVRLAAENSRDSIIKIEEKIAVGNINFGISKAEYVLEKEKFLNSTNGKLGTFKFSMRPDFYDENRGLRHLRLYGQIRNYNYFKNYMLDDFSSLKSILIKKYGIPTDTFIYNQLPNIEWKIGNKSIRLNIVEDDYNFKYRLLLHFKYETQDEARKLEKKVIEKEKASIEKAIEDL